MTRTSNFNFSTSLPRPLLRVAIENLRLLRASAECTSSHSDRAGAAPPSRRVDDANLLGLGLLDAHQRRVAQLVDAALNREHGGERHLDVLEPAVLEFALHADARRLHFSTCMMMVACGNAEQFRQHDAGLPVAEIVGLQAGENQVRRFGFTASASRRANPSVSAGPAELVFLDVNRAVGALGERLANGLRGALGSGAQTPPPRRRASPSAAALLPARRRPAR